MGHLKLWVIVIVASILELTVTSSPVPTSTDVNDSSSTEKGSNPPSPVSCGGVTGFFHLCPLNQTVSTSTTTTTAPNRKTREVNQTDAVKRARREVGSSTESTTDTDWSAIDSTPDTSEERSNETLYRRDTSSVNEKSKKWKRDSGDFDPESSSGVESGETVKRSAPSVTLSESATPRVATSKNSKREVDGDKTHSKESGTIKSPDSKAEEKLDAKRSAQPTEAPLPATKDQGKVKRDVPPLGGASPTDDATSSEENGSEEVEKRSTEAKDENGQKKVEPSKTIREAVDGKEEKAKVHQPQAATADIKVKEARRDIPPLGGEAPPKSIAKPLPATKDQVEVKRDVPPVTGALHADDSSSNVQRSSEELEKRNVEPMAKNQMKEKRDVPPLGGASPADTKKARRDLPPQGGANPSKSAVMPLSANKDQLKVKRDVSPLGGASSINDATSSAENGSDDDEKRSVEAKDENETKNVESRNVEPMDKGQVKEKRDVPPLGGASPADTKKTRRDIPPQGEKTPSEPAVKPLPVSKDQVKVKRDLPPLGEVSPTIAKKTRRDIPPLGGSDPTKADKSTDSKIISGKPLIRRDLEEDNEKSVDDSGALGKNRNVKRDVDSSSDSSSDSSEEITTTMATTTQETSSRRRRGTDDSEDKDNGSDDTDADGKSRKTRDENDGDDSDGGSDDDGCDDGNASNDSDGNATGDDSDSRRRREAESTSVTAKGAAEMDLRKMRRERSFRCLGSFEIVQRTPVIFGD